MIGRLDRRVLTKPALEPINECQIRMFTIEAETLGNGARHRTREILDSALTTSSGSVTQGCEV